jgi:pimeloyl-ACP methyl ester carboxylesterase
LSSLVLTHGLGHSTQSWRRLTPELADDFELRAWDLPGHGERIGDVLGRCDPAAVIDELQRQVQACQSAPILIGHSAGGHISLRYAACNPSHVRALVLISAGPGFRNPAKMADWNARIDLLAESLPVAAGAGAVAHMLDSLVLDALPSMTIPTLVVYGAADDPSYLSGARYLADHLTKVIAVAIAGAKHDPQLTHPSLVNRAIRDFVDRLPAVKG